MMGSGKESDWKINYLLDALFVNSIDQLIEQRVGEMFDSTIEGAHLTNRPLSRFSVRPDFG